MATHPTSSLFSHAGFGVFKAGGGLDYHHGGPSLQELIVPVLTVRLPSATQSTTKRQRVAISNVPDEVTNRIFSVTVELGGRNLDLFSAPTLVQLVLLSGTRQVGMIGLAIDGELDAEAGTVTMQPGEPLTVAFLLSDDTAQSIRIVVRDPVTDAELYRSPMEIPVHLESARPMTVLPLPTRDALDDKVNRVFAGKVVRKDLVRKVKVGANVPVFVLEYPSRQVLRLLGRARHPDGSCKSSTTPSRTTTSARTNRRKPRAKVKERGSYTFIDKVKVRLVDSDYWAEVVNFGHKFVHIPDHYVATTSASLTGGIWAQVDMRFEYDEETTG